MEKKRREEEKQAQIEAERARQEEAERTRQEEAEKARQEQLLRQQQAEEASPQSSSDQDEEEDTPSIWRHLKFEPEFDTQETREAYLVHSAGVFIRLIFLIRYIIKAFLPGMNPKDIKVDLESSSTLVLSTLFEYA